MSFCVSTHSYRSARHPMTGHPVMLAGQLTWRRLSSGGTEDGVGEEDEVGAVEGPVDGVGEELSVEDALEDAVEDAVNDASDDVLDDVEADVDEAMGDGTQESPSST